MKNNEEVRDYIEEQNGEVKEGQTNSRQGTSTSNNTSGVSGKQNDRRIESIVKLFNANLSDARATPNRGILRKTIAKERVIYVVPDLRPLVDTMCATTIRLFKVQALENSPLLSPASFVAYLLSLFILYVLNSDLSSPNPSQEALNLIENDDRVAKLLEDAMNFKIPPILKPLFAEFEKYKLPVNEAIQLVPSFGPTTVRHDIGKLVTTRILFSLHDALAGRLANQANLPEVFATTLFTDQAANPYPMINVLAVSAINGQNNQQIDYVDNVHFKMIRAISTFSSTRAQRSRITFEQFNFSVPDVHVWNAYKYLLPLGNRHDVNEFRQFMNQMNYCLESISEIKTSAMSEYIKFGSHGITRYTYSNEEVYTYIGNRLQGINNPAAMQTVAIDEIPNANIHRQAHLPTQNQFAAWVQNQPNFLGNSDRTIPAAEGYDIEDAINSEIYLFSANDTIATSYDTTIFAGKSVVNREVRFEGVYLPTTSETGLAYYERIHETAIPINQTQPLFSDDGIIAVPPITDYQSRNIPGIYMRTSPIPRIDISTVDNSITMTNLNRLAHVVRTQNSVTPPLHVTKSPAGAQVNANVYLNVWSSYRTIGTDNGIRIILNPIRWFKINYPIMITESSYTSLES